MRNRSGWSVVVPYALVCAATQMLWLTYAVIDTDTAHSYHVSVGTVGWLANIFPLLYVLLALPSGGLLDRAFRPSLAVASLLVAVGGLLRLVDETFAWAIAGQIVVAIVQPLVLSGIGKVAAEYLDEGQRATGIAIGSAGSFVGMLAALVIGPAVGTHGHLERVLLVEGVLAALPSVWLALALRRPGNDAAATDDVLLIKGAARRLWSVPLMRTLCGLVFVGFGVFAGLMTWLQTLLSPAGVSERTAGVLLAVMVVAGVVACAALPPLIDRRAGERRFMVAAVLMGAVGCFALAVVHGVVGVGVVLAVMGLLLLPALPIVLTGAERLAGPAAGTAGAIVWLVGNLGGVVVVGIVQVLVHHPAPAFVAMGVVALVGLPFALKLKPLNVEALRPVSSQG